MGSARGRADLNPLRTPIVGLGLLVVAACRASAMSLLELPLMVADECNGEAPPFGDVLADVCGTRRFKRPPAPCSIHFGQTKYFSRSAGATSSRFELRSVPAPFTGIPQIANLVTQRHSPFSSNGIMSTNYLPKFCRYMMKSNQSVNQSVQWVSPSLGRSIRRPVSQ